MSEGKAPSFDHRPEWEILLASGAPARAAAVLARIEVLGSQDLDWDWLLQASLHHGMMPLLYQGLLTACRGAVPDGAWHELEQLYKRNVVRTLWLAGELHNCLNHLAAYSIDAIPFKGPILASAVYGDVALRQYADLDILVRRAEVVRARELLVSQGYRHEFQLNAAQEAAFLRAQSAYALTHPSGGEVLVELHWRFFETYFSAPLASEELWQRALPVSLLGQEVPSLVPEDLLLLLCGHGTKHGWQRVGWVCDIAWLLNAQRKLDWPAVQDRARQAGSLRMLHLGLYLARDLFQAPLPGDVATRVQADVAAEALAHQVQNWYLHDVQPQTPSNTALWRFHLQARERWADRARYVLRLALTPMVGDWHAVPLPSSLFSLYYVLRPLRLLATYGADLWKRPQRQ